METFSRITAMLLIITGILIILGCLALGATGTIRFLINIPAAAHPLRAGGSLGLIVLSIIFIQGLTITALGEGLYLLGDVVIKQPAIQPNNG